MNQIRHILSACLILLMIFMAFFLYTTFPESGIVAKELPVDGGGVMVTSGFQSKGEALFKQNCGACHGLDKGIIGPPLRGVHQRGPWANDKEILKRWIKDPAPFLLNDPYARDLKSKYKTPMPAQVHLSDAEIEEVIRYLSGS